MENSGPGGVHGVECGGGIGGELKIHLILSPIEVLEDMGSVVQSNAQSILDVVGHVWVWWRVWLHRRGVMIHAVVRREVCAHEV